RLAGGLRPVPADPAVRRGQRRHDAGRVQDDLLVGMDPPAAGPGHRPGLRRALRDPAGPAPAAAAAGLALRGAAGPGRPAGADRLVDGDLGPVRAGRRGSRAADDPPGPGPADPVRTGVDRTGSPARAGPDALAGGVGEGGGGPAGAGLRPVPAGRAGGRLQGRLHLHRLAVDERPVAGAGRLAAGRGRVSDRKTTRLAPSPAKTSYAV